MAKPSSDGDERTRSNLRKCWTPKAKPPVSESGPQKKYDTKHKGELAELEFILKATKKGFPVSKPYGENQRYDVIVDGGIRTWRVQVKTSSVTRDNGFFVRAHRRTRNGSIPYTPKEIDFLAAVVHEDIWYIIPIKALAGRLNLNVYPLVAERDTQSANTSRNTARRGLCSETRAEPGSAKQSASDGLGPAAYGKGCRTRFPGSMKDLLTWGQSVALLR